MSVYAPCTRSELHSLAKDLPKIEKHLLKFQELSVAF